MLHYPTGFEASELAAGRPLTNPRIGHQSWLRDLDATNVIVSTEKEDAPRDAPLRPDTAEYWQAEFLPATWTVNLDGVSQAVDYIGIAGHTIGSNGYSVLVETDTNGDGVYIAFGSPTAVSPDDDSPLLFLDDSISTQNIRVTITGSGIPPRIASIYAGQILTMETEVFGTHGPLTLNRDTSLFRSLSRGGQFLGQGIRRNGVITTVAFQYLTHTFVRSDFDEFVLAARQFPYFFAWRPLDFPAELGYVWTPQDIRPQQMGVAGFMSVNWQIIGIGNE